MIGRDRKRQDTSLFRYTCQILCHIVRHHKIRTAWNNRTTFHQIGWVIGAYNNCVNIKCAAIWRTPFQL